MSAMKGAAGVERLHRRLKQLKSRVRVRRWELRQREHAKGSWYRLRRVLSSAEAVYAIPAEAAAALESEGAEPLEAGFDFHPPLRMYWVDLQQARQIPGRQELAVRLDHALLRSRTLALVRFEE